MAARNFDAIKIKYIVRSFNLQRGFIVSTMIDNIFMIKN